jgi:signal transduction histidine kinase
VNQGLRARASDVAGLAARRMSLGGAGDPRGLDADGQRFAQVLDPRGRVLQATAQLHDRSLLTPAELARARRRALFLDRPPPPGGEDSSRLLAMPATIGGRPMVVVVGSSLGVRDDALDGLREQLLIGGPLVLLLASLAGYGLAAAALGPVESMRRRAAAISATRPGQRLPIPRARDEVRRLSETLNEMLARLEAALARERRLVSDASHELRTPLSILRAELELALSRPRSAEELADCLRSANEETDRLGQLAEDLLVIARSDHGELPVRRVDARAEDLLAGVRRRFLRRATDAGRMIEAEPCGDLEVKADPLRLEQALGNLVDNALRYSDGAIRLAARRVNGAVELHVADEGRGFPPALLPRAFERFARSDASRSRGGAGLGLSIAQAIAHAHGGTAHAANRPEGGADVWLTLPDGPSAPAARSRE